MTPEPAVRDAAANQGDDSASDGVEGDDAGQQECEHDQGSAALTIAVCPCDRQLGDTDQ